MDQLVAGGADCGPVNPLMGLINKQLNKDMSHQRDRFVENPQRPGMMKPAGVPMTIQEQQMMDDFFKQSQGLPPQQRAEMAFRFNEMARELDKTGVPMQNDWSKEFHAKPMTKPISQPGMPQQMVSRPGFQMQYANRQFQPMFQQPMQQPVQKIVELDAQQEADFQLAFEKAQKLIEKPSEPVERSWAEEFAEQNKERPQETPESRDALAKAAAMLLDVVSSETNPKFKESKFLDFMKQLRDGEVTVQDNQVVEGDGISRQAQPSSMSPSTADEWAQDFTKRLQTHIMDGPMNDMQPPEEWVQEFTEDDFLNGDGMERYMKEVESDQARLGNMAKFVQEMRKEMKDMEGYEEADIEPAEWAELAKEWENYASNTYGQRSSNPAYDDYQFQVNNPFLNDKPDFSFLTDISKHKNLAESILALEAAVQADPTLAEAWYLLGTQQQVNERDPAAIAALRRAVALDPRQLDAWVALAVSFTNENAREDALDAFESWMENNERYHQVLERHRAKNPGTLTGSARHKMVTTMFLDAARTKPGQDMDPAVQESLGVLFNASQEYDKAIDCFQAAIAGRPNDYMLYNKLGATLANAQRPEEAISAYGTALEINPAYIRARYNLAISCMNMGMQKESAEHLLHALSMQQQGAAQQGFDGLGSSLVSDAIWEMLRMLLLSMDRGDLVDNVAKRNLDGFRGEFDF